MQNQLPSSVQTVMSIDDLLMEILLHLPAQSIIRFKMVSKYWYSVITSPVFALRHTRKPTAVAGILFQHCDFLSNGTYEFAPLSIEIPASPPIRQLKFTDDPSVGIKIKQACNGLLLCSTFRLMATDSSVYQNCVHNNKYYVCNPITKRFFTLPESQKIGSGSSSCIRGMSLAFDPAKSPHYKVVCVSRFAFDFDFDFDLFEQNIYDAQFQIEVYSSETNSWRVSVEAFTAKSNFGGHGVHWNGAIHWMYNEYKDLLFLTLDDETLHMMPMPIIVHVDDDESCYYRTRRLVESCDHLHLIEAEHTMGIHIRIYEMKRDRSEWFLKYRVNFYALPYQMTVSLLALVRNKEDDDAYLFLLNKGNVSGEVVGKVIRCDLWKNTTQVCSEFEWGNTESCYSVIGLWKFNGLQFMESLASV